MHITIERPTRKNYFKALCIHGVDAIDKSVLEEVQALCDEQYRSGETDDRLAWNSFKTTIQTILEHDLCPDTPVRVLGPIYVDGVVFPQRGDDVTIAKGSIVHSTHPKIPSEGIEQKRRQTLHVHDVRLGFVDSWHGPRVQDIEVTWAGTGGYWKWTSLNNVVAVETPQPA